MKQVLCLSVIFAVLAPSAYAKDRNPFPQEVVTPLQKSVGLLVAKQRFGIATAFCIHPSGFYATCLERIPYKRRRLLPGEALHLVDFSDPKTPKAVPARLIRFDPDTGLGIVKADIALKAPAVKLGSTHLLRDGDDLLAISTGSSGRNDIGFQQLVSRSGIGTSRGVASELSKLRGRIKSFHFGRHADPVVGAPVLSTDGSVVGIVSRRRSDPAGQFVWPVEVLKELLRQPHLALKPVSVPRERLEQPALFEAECAGFTELPEPVSIEMVLTRGPSDRRTYSMKLIDGTYRVQAPPVVKVDGKHPLWAQLQTDANAIEGLVEDQEIRIGDNPVRLRDIGTLRWKPKPEARLHNGSRSSGSISGMDTISVCIGKKMLPISTKDLWFASFTNTQSVSSIRYTLTATSGGAIIAQASGMIPIVEPRSKPNIQPPVLPNERIEIVMPSKIEDLIVGGGGRFLIAHLQERRELVIFDVNQGGIVRILPLANDEVRITAGMTKLMILYTQSKIIQRWGLETFQRESSATLNTGGVIRAVSMGSASEGPLLVLSTGGDPDQIFLYDIHSMAKLDVEPPRNMGIDLRKVKRMIASASGSVFALHYEKKILEITGNKLILHKDPAGRVNHDGVPSPDGEVIFCGKKFYSKDLKAPLPSSPKSPVPLHPGNFCGYVHAINANYFVSVQRGAPIFDTKGREIKNAPLQMSLYIMGDPSAIVHNVSIPLDQSKINLSDPKIRMYQRLHLAPEARLLVIVPFTNDRLIVQHLDVEQLLEESKADYLFVASRAPKHFQKGETYTYPIIVRSRKGGVTYNLEWGPEGMTVSPKGKVTWHVPETLEATEEEVTILIRDGSGQERFHTFTISVEK